MILFKPFNIPNIKKIKEEFAVEKKLPELFKGKNSAIICKTSNLDTDVLKVINGIFENGGQACVAISRVIIHENIFDIFVEKIKRIIYLVNAN